jgi:hypothetical protein
MPKAIDINNSGSMDARSAPDQIQTGDLRYIKNFRMPVKGRRCRTPGFSKLLTQGSYNNQDLHDQLLSISGQASRAPVTFLFEAVSTRKATKLLAGTSNVLFALNTSTGNWKILADQYGTSATRWRAAQLQDTVVLSNNADFIGYWMFDQGITEESDQSVAAIPDLRDNIEITKAGVVVGWRGHIFLMNVVISGSVKSNSIFWCNYERPLDWQPSDASTAGSTEVDYGETILAAHPLLGRLIVFTNKGIYEINAVGGEEVFTISPRFQSVDGEACLFYPNTLVSKGDELVYAGVDGIYTFSLYTDKPKRVEWIHKASSVMYDNINRDNCEIHVAGYDAERKEILISYATGENTLPNETLAIHTEHPYAYVIDHGFTAMVTYTYKDSDTVRDFLLERCICDGTGLDDYWSQFDKEGQFCAGSAPDDAECPTPPASLFTADTRVTYFDSDESVETEDWTVDEEDVDSLCAQLEGLTLGELCESELRSDECQSGQRFVVASSTDYCLKEISDNYYRELCTDFDDCGTYEQRGYVSLIRSGPIHGGLTEKEKIWSNFEVEATFTEQATPSSWSLRIGNHSQAVDPNNDNCGILWDTQDTKQIECLTDGTTEEHATNVTRPSDDFGWPLYYAGNYLYFELSIVNPDVSPIDTGGECCISRVTIDMDGGRRRR